MKIGEPPDPRFGEYLSETLCAAAQSVGHYIMLYAGFVRRGGKIVTKLKLLLTK
jgi:hypothetical protein